MLKWYIIGTLISIIAGFVLAIGLYGYIFYYVLILGIATIILVPVILISLYRKDTDRKIPLRFLAFGYLVALTAGLRLDFLELRRKERGDKVISALYEYRQKKGKFPLKKDELPQSIASINGNYVPDSTLTSFKFYYRNLFGVPKVFSSEDSVWAIR